MHLCWHRVQEQQALKDHKVNTGLEQLWHFSLELICTAFVCRPVQVLGERLKKLISLFLMLCLLMWLSLEWCYMAHTYVFCTSRQHHRLCVWLSVFSTSPVPISLVSPLFEPLFLSGQINIPFTVSCAPLLFALILGSFNPVWTDLGAICGYHFGVETLFECQYK